MNIKLISKTLLTMIALLALVNCQKPNKVSVEELGEIVEEVKVPNFKALAQKLTEQMFLTEGTQVLLVAKPGQFDEIVPLLADRIAEQGGVYLGALSVTDKQPEEWKTDFVNEAVKADSLQLVRLLRKVDLGVMMPGPVPTDLSYGILQDILEEGSRRTIHFHWSGAYDMNGSALEVNESIDAFYQEVVLNTDYEQLAVHQLAFEEAMRGNVIHVTTAEGTDITFEIGDRPVTKQDGNASAERAVAGLNLIDREIEIPAGAVRVAPMEETVNGTIAFPDAIWDGQEVKGLLMTFKNGKIMSYTAENGNEGVKNELSKAGGNSGQYFREFALGFNPKLAIPKGDNLWIPYYGYGSGIVRLSLGDNSELGGNVTGGYVRWNFFPNATVTVGDEVWVKNGELVR